MTHASYNTIPRQPTGVGVVQVVIIIGTPGV
jgi:hypothetical protein